MDRVKFKFAIVLFRADALLSAIPEQEAFELVIAAHLQYESSDRADPAQWVAFEYPVWVVEYAGSPEAHLSFEARALLIRKHGVDGKVQG